MTRNHEKSPSEPPNAPQPAEDGERAHEKTLSSESAVLPSSADTSLPVSGSLGRLADQARDYARQATAENTNAAYKADWAHYTRWCRRHGRSELGGDWDGQGTVDAGDASGKDETTTLPQTIGLYITHCAAPDDGTSSQSADRPLSVSTIERRLSGIAWHLQQRGITLDRKDRHIATVLAGIRRKHARPPVQKEAILPEDMLAMLATLPFDLRGLRDRAILLIGYAGGLRRSEIVGLDYAKDDTDDSGGWVQIFPEGALLTLRGKSGWREVEIARGSSDDTCPVHALEQWLHFAKIDFGPIFQRTTRDSRRALGLRMSDRHVARLIKQCVLDAGLRPDLSDEERAALYSGHSLRAGLASSALVDERHIQKQLGHASVEMTRRYQRRRDRFRVNLTKAAGL